MARGWHVRNERNERDNYHNLWDRRRFHSPGSSPLLALRPSLLVGWSWPGKKEEGTSMQTVSQKKTEGFIYLPCQFHPRKNCSCKPWPSLGENFSTCGDGRDPVFWYWKWCFISIHAFVFIMGPWWSFLWVSRRRCQWHRLEHLPMKIQHSLKLSREENLPFTRSEWPRKREHVRVPTFGWIFLDLLDCWNSFTQFVIKFVESEANWFFSIFNRCNLLAKWLWSLKGGYKRSRCLFPSH